MNLRKAIVPSAFVVAGMTAMFFQPASSASPQETDSSVVADSSLDDALVGDSKSEEVGEVSSADRGVSGLVKETSPKLKGSVEESSSKEAEPSDETSSAKVTKGSVAQSNSAMLREGSTPQKIDLERFNVAPDPEPEPETVDLPQGSASGEEVAESAPVQGPAPVYNANTGNAVVDAALSQVGTPYVWGGSQPGGFDCSGLTSWAYAQAGKSIPRTSGAQWSGGQSVSVDDMQPGDIVVSYGGGHVGIYIGDGQMVHAPTTGDVVKVSPLQAIDGVVRF